MKPPLQNLSQKKKREVSSILYTVLKFLEMGKIKSGSVCRGILNSQSSAALEQIERELFGKELI